MEPISVSPLIYCLELEQGKYYVGITYNLNFRFAQHMGGQGARWTKLYKPLRIAEVISEGVDRTMEDTITKRYIDKYGAENVRGGSHCKV
jgi:predicted GIY-YIG superfamily endonuclease